MSGRTPWCGTRRLRRWGPSPTTNASSCCARCAPAGVAVQSCLSLCLWAGANDQIVLLPAWLLQCHFRLLPATRTLPARSSTADQMCSLNAPIPLFPMIAAQYATHPEPIVADSCIVALDMLDFEQSGSFSYADTGAAAGGEAAAVQAAA